MKKNSRKQTANRAKEIKIENNAPPVVNWPDSDARRKKIFGNRVLNTVEDFLKSRHRDGIPPATTAEAWRTHPRQPAHGCAVELKADRFWTLLDVG